MEAASWRERDGGRSCLIADFAKDSLTLLIFLKILLQKMLELKNMIAYICKVINHNQISCVTAA